MPHTIISTSAILVYASWVFVGLITIVLFVPETKRLILEQLDHFYAIPTRSVIRHQVGTVLPWMFQTYVLRRNIRVSPTESQTITEHDTAISRVGKHILEDVSTMARVRKYIFLHLGVIVPPCPPGQERMNWQCVGILPFLLFSNQTRL